MKKLIVAIVMGGTMSAALAQVTRPGGAPPATNGSMSSAGTSMMTMSATDFVTKAGIDGMTEVQVGQMAMQKAQGPSIKTFAQRMVTDHTKANDELMSIASAKQIPAPTQLDSEHQAMVQALSAKSGPAFDAAYVAQMSVAHDKAIALFTTASKSTDPDIAAFATKTLPTLQMHKEMVGKLQASTPAANM